MFAFISKMTHLLPKTADFSKILAKESIYLYFLSEIYVAKNTAIANFNLIEEVLAVMMNYLGENKEQIFAT